MSNLKVYQCDETELYAAESVEQAIELYEEHTGDKPDEGYPREWTDAELDAPQPEFDENEYKTGEMTSVRKMLEEQNDSGWLAGSNQ